LQSLKIGAPNYLYFPVIFDSERRLIETAKKMNANNIFPRRYFYPSVNTYTKIIEYQPVPISECLSKRILCLPLYWSLKMDEIEKILEIVTEEGLK